MLKKPEWLRRPYIENSNSQAIEGILDRSRLATVCREANCPNLMECFSRGTATFMILGTNCTRDCRFCNVKIGVPSEIDEDEPNKVAQAVDELGLSYVVITSVTRDDLPDGGADHFSKTIREIKDISPKTTIEVLIPDFGGDIAALKTVVSAFPDVISHNMETVPSLYHKVRPQAEYQRSLTVLKNIKRLSPNIRSKTGIMLGLGEARKEVCELFVDLIGVGCEFLTIGQYLAPSKDHISVSEYISPEIFDEYAKIAREMGFAFVASGVFVRSSYNAQEAFS